MAKGGKKMVPKKSSAVRVRKSLMRGAPKSVSDGSSSEEEPFEEATVVSKKLESITNLKDSSGSESDEPDNPIEDARVASRTTSTPNARSVSIGGYVSNTPKSSHSSAVHSPIQPSIRGKDKWYKMGST
jgi:hypothetical protein